LKRDELVMLKKNEAGDLAGGEAPPSHAQIFNRFCAKENDDPADLLSDYVAFGLFMALEAKWASTGPKSTKQYEQFERNNLTDDHIRIHRRRARTLYHSLRTKP
jgi:hypothetical protein